MIDISIVAARSQNNVIGQDLEIPWRVKGEQQLFKRITMGGTLIMGRLTFESIGRPLPGRKTVIVSRNPDLQADACLTASNLNDALKTAFALAKPIFVVGGGEIYRQTLPMAKWLHLTTIETEVQGNVHFPSFDRHDYQLLENETFESNLNYRYEKLERIK